MIQDYNINHLLDDAMSSTLKGMMICLPATIVSIPNNLDDMAVDVVPCVNELKPDGSSEEIDTIYRVPVQMPGSSTSLVNIPLNVGDNVILVFSQRSLDGWKTSNGYPTTPPTVRRWDTSDAIAIPCIFPFPRSVNNPRVRKWKHNTRDLCVAHNIGSASEAEVRITQSGNILFNTDGDVKWKVGGKMTIEGDVEHTGDFKSNNVTISEHKHSAGGNPPMAGT